MHEQEPAEGEVERHAGRRLKLEKISGDLLESGATFAAEVLQRLGTERAVDLNTGDPALEPHAVGHQPHYRAWAGATSRQLMPGPSPTAASTCAVAPCHIRA
jgi:hypothetical protein